VKFWYAILGVILLSSSGVWGAGDLSDFTSQRYEHDRGSRSAPFLFAYELALNHDSVFKELSIVVEYPYAGVEFDSPVMEQLHIIDFSLKFSIGKEQVSVSKDDIHAVFHKNVTKRFMRQGRQQFKTLKPFRFEIELQYTEAFRRAGVSQREFNREYRFLTLDLDKTDLIKNRRWLASILGPLRQRMIWFPVRPINKSRTGCRHSLEKFERHIFDL